MPTQHLLSPLNSDALPSPETPGVWVQETGYEWLGKLAQCLAQQPEGQSDEDLLSIPDVWAQAMVFESALLDVSHPLHRRSVREWRGLIGLLALSAQRGMALQSRLIDVQALAEPDDGSSMFVRVAHSLRPACSLVATQTWSKIGFLTLDGRPLAMIVPHVLICPVRGHEAALDATIEWRTSPGGGLDDPLCADNLTPEELGLIARYAKALQQGLRPLETDGPRDRRLSQLLTRLEEFAEALERTFAKAMGQKGRLSLDDTEVYSVPQQFELPPPLYSLINHFEALIPRQRYDTAIPTRAEFRKALAGILLLDERLPSLLNSTSSAIRAWDTDTLETALRHPAHRQRVIDGAAAGGFLAIGIDDLFTPALCHLSEGAITTHGAAESFTLPLTPLALLLFPPSELRERVVIRPEGGGYRVMLRVELLDDRENSRPCQLSRFYPKAHRASSPASLSVWPDFQSVHWDYYYLFYGVNPEESLTPTLPVTRSDLLTALKPAAPAAHRVANAARLPQGLETAILDGKRRRMLREERQQVRAMVLMTQQPEAILCTVAAVEAGGLKTRLPVGLILAAEAKQVAPRKPSNWKIGVDFGTTNTCIFYRRDSRPPERVVFRDRCISPFRGQEQATEAQDEHALEFLPLSDRPLPFQSVLQDRSNLPNEGMPRWPLWTERIYYVRDVQVTLNALRGDGNSALRFDLKWSEIPEDRNRRQDFLAQAALEAMAEAAAEGMNPADVHWFFSYPEAFKGEQLADYTGIIPEALGTALSSQQNVPAPDETRTSPESVCAALYFHSHGIALTGTVVTFDVGGGTTDISLWQSRRLVWRSSVRFAGRDIVIGYLARQKEYILALTRQSQSLREAYEEFQTTVQETQRVFNATEVFVNSDTFSKAFQKERAAIGGTPGAKGLHATVEFAMAGLLYYVGLVYGALVRSGVCSADAGTIQVCYGGRGSLMMRELVGTTVAERMTALFNTAAGLGKDNGVPEQHLTLSYSKNPKEEVAFGLLIDRADAAELRYNQEELPPSIIGESILIGGKPCTWDSRADMLDPTAEWRCGDLSQLERFVTCYRSELGRIVPFDTVIKSHVKTQVNEALVAERNQAAAMFRRGKDAVRTMGIEPPFILALRALNTYLNVNRQFIQ
ncbi:hypothetical protein [Azospirillum lipoferum]|uniref:Uncharacterized protein n=1 Tax=Azospirillum lipoferum (strain 4B) TaxID=862719 RepID=G7Z9C1_AZOL4|nr:hypothetical protein [Azospirillum lipoferum]CBS86077.1 protein of unknown function [Azospirillum lipoferum 4B]